MIDRLTDMAMACSEGKLKDVAFWLESLGCTITYQTDGEVHLKGISSIMVGLTATDPNTCAVQIGFALAGMYWPQAFPGFQQNVNKRWKVRSKQNKEDFHANKKH